MSDVERTKREAKAPEWPTMKALTHEWERDEIQDFTYVHVYDRLTALHNEQMGKARERIAELEGDRLMLEEERDEYWFRIAPLEATIATLEAELRAARKVEVTDPSTETSPDIRASVPDAPGPSHGEKSHLDPSLPGNQGRVRTKPIRRKP